MLRDTLETEPEDLIEPLNGKLEVFYCKDLLFGVTVATMHWLR